MNTTIFSRFLALIVFWFLYVVQIKAQEPLLISETMVKVSALGDETLYFGFAEGDEVIVDMEVVKGKNINQFEMLAYPKSSIFMEYKPKLVKDRRVTIKNTGVYSFHFSNEALGGRVCKLKVQRIPKSEETKEFNSTVYWETKHDTTYKVIQEKYLVKSDTGFQHVVDQVAKVHSAGNMNGNSSSLNFNLPKNTIAWSYYIGVDQKGQEAFEEGMSNLSELSSMAKHPMVALALNLSPMIPKMQSGEDVQFYIVQGDNINIIETGNEFYYIKRGKVVNDFGRMEVTTNKPLHVYLSNDNAVMAIMVMVKITAITVTETWDTRHVEQMNVTTIKVPFLKD